MYLNWVLNNVCFCVQCFCLSQSKGMKDSEMNGMNGGGWVGWIKPLSLKIPQEETKQSHTYLAWIRLVHLYQHISCLVCSQEAFAAKHPHIKEISILTTTSLCLGDCVLCKTGNSLFSFQRCADRVHIFLLLGKKNMGDCGSLCHVFTTEDSWAV